MHYYAEEVERNCKRSGMCLMYQREGFASKRMNHVEPGEFPQGKGVAWGGIKAALFEFKAKQKENLPAHT
jgi:hypothetical protein